MPSIKSRTVKSKQPYFKPEIVSLIGEGVSHWQKKAVRDRVLWGFKEKSPEVRRRLIALLKKRTTKYGGLENTTVFVKYVTQKELDIIRKLRDAGILTEEPADFKLKTAIGHERAPMIFLNAGLSFEEFYDSEKDVQKLRAAFMPVADLIGRMHALGIEHGHVTTGNVNIYNGRLCLADFSLAEQHIVDWGSADSIYNAFIRDYATRISRSKEFMNRSACKEFFRRIISYYPTSEEVKQNLIGRLNRALLDFFIDGTVPFIGPG